MEGLGPPREHLIWELLPLLPSLAKGALCLSPEVTKTTLLEEMRTTMVAKSRLLELEEKVQLLTEQRESLGQELSTTTTQLEKEKAKVESMLKHEEVWLGSLSPALELLCSPTACRGSGLSSCEGGGERVQQQPHAGSPALYSPCRPSRGPCCSSSTAWTRSVRNCKPAWERPRRTRPGWQSSWRSAGSRAGNSYGRSRSVLAASTRLGGLWEGGSLGSCWCGT